MNLVKAVAGEFEPHVLWLKTPKFFDVRSSSGSGSDDSLYTSHEIWAKSLYSGFLYSPGAWFFGAGGPGHGANGDVCARYVR